MPRKRRQKMDWRKAKKGQPSKGFDVLKVYGYPKVSSEEVQRRIYARFAAGDTNAKKRLLQEFSRLAFDIGKSELFRVGRFNPENLADVFQEIMSKLNERLDKKTYDPNHESKTKPSTYFAKEMRWNARRYVSEEILGTTQRYMKIYGDYLRLVDEQKAKSKTLSLEKAAAMLEMSPSTLLEIIKQSESLQGLSLDALEKEKSSELKPPDQLLSEKENQKIIGSLLAKLPERDARVLKLRYGIVDGRHRTLEEVGTILNVTRERARQIERRAKTKLLALAEGQGIDLKSLFH